MNAFPMIARCAVRQSWCQEHPMESGNLTDKGPLRGLHSEIWTWTSAQRFRHQYGSQPWLILKEDVFFA